MSGTPAGGHFTASGRHFVDEDRIVLTCVGVDIGSSTSHLLFSRLELERQDSRYVTVRRELLHESDILFTPYVAGNTIDSAALRRFVEGQYQATGLNRDQVDTGALILTGVALLRQNARTIAELFAEEAGRFVAVSAGDNLEATMAAYGSGAVALSDDCARTVMNVDLGGGTTKVAICQAGRVVDLMALNIGARLVAYGGSGVVTRLEEAGRRTAESIGLDLVLGCRVQAADLDRLAGHMADQLIAAIGIDEALNLRSVGPREQVSAAPSAGSPQAGLETSGLLRTPPLRQRGPLGAIIFSGGVAEFIYGRQQRDFGDLGPRLAAAIRQRLDRLGVALVETPAGIRATVVGASQYTVQVSGSTIFLSPPDVVPVRSVPVVAPDFAWADELASSAVRDELREAMRRFDLQAAPIPIAVAFRWHGSATFGRLQAFCSGLVDGMGGHMEQERPLILVCDGDVGGLLGLHLRREMRLSNPIISIDGIDLRDFDYIDIGALIPSSGAVPVVIKSLVFPE